jgi:predicted dinucleotide-binding enzyme
MRIAVIGAGRVGQALGARWQDAGHDLVYGVRDPGDPRHGERSTAPVEAAPIGSDVVLLALPWAAMAEVVPRLPVGDAVVIDATNPLAEGASGLLTPPEGSGAAAVAAWCGSPAVAKAFNTTGSQNMVDPRYRGARPMMPVAADDPRAKSTTIALAEEIGFDAFDAGGLAAAADLEHLALLWIRMAYRLGNGADFAFARVRRQGREEDT